MLVPMIKLLPIFNSRGRMQGLLVVFSINLIREGKIQPEDMNIIWQSEDIPGSPYVARSDLDKSIQESFKIAMLTIHSEAPTSLENFDDSIEKYIEVDRTNYNPIRNIATILGKEYMYEHFLKSE